VPGGSARPPPTLPPAIYATVANFDSVTMGHGIALPPWHILNADVSPSSGHSRLGSRDPNPRFTVQVHGQGILAIVVVSRNFLDSFLSVTRGPAEGFGSLSPIHLDE